MIPIVIGSITEFSGKSLIWLGMGLRFKEDGFRTGFFKPLGALPTRVEGALVDEDAVFLKRAIAVEDPMDSICPVVITEEVLNGLLKEKRPWVRKKVMESFQRLSRDRDILLVHALGGLDSGTTVGISMVDFVTEARGRVILVDKLEDTVSALDGLDAFLRAREVLKDKFLGVIFNLIPPARLRYIREVIVPYLKSNGVDTLGVIPKDPVIGAVPIRELVKVLEGELLYGEERLDELVEHIMVGAMNVESALKYFRRVANKAVITGGDRSDIQLAALETPTSCLILTGGFYPSESILSRAREGRIPVVVVGVDTATAVEACEGLSSHLQRWSEAKLPRIREVVNREINFPLLYEKLGLKK